MQAPYETSTIDVIHRMIRIGELPYGENCALSGRPTKDTMILRVQCERVWTRGSSLDFSDKAIIGFLLFGWIGAIVEWTRKDTPRREFGRETCVDLPLRVSSDLQAQVTRKGQRAIKTMLRQVPIYDTLLKEYPDASVVAVQTA